LRKVSRADVAAIAPLGKASAMLTGFTHLDDLGLHFAGVSKDRSSGVFFQAEAIHQPSSTIGDRPRSVFSGFGTRRVHPQVSWSILDSPSAMSKPPLGVDMVVSRTVKSYSALRVNHARRPTSAVVFSGNGA